MNDWQLCSQMRLFKHFLIEHQSVTQEISCLEDQHVASDICRSAFKSHFCWTKSKTFSQSTFFMKCSKYDSNFRNCLWSCSKRFRAQKNLTNWSKLSMWLSKVLLLKPVIPFYNEATDRFDDGVNDNEYNH